MFAPNSGTNVAYQDLWAILMPVRAARTDTFVPYGPEYGAFVGTQTPSEDPRGASARDLGPPRGFFCGPSRLGV